MSSWAADCRGRVGEEVTDVQFWGFHLTGFLSGIALFKLSEGGAQRCPCHRRQCLDLLLQGMEAPFYLSLLMFQEGELLDNKSAAQRCSDNLQHFLFLLCWLMCGQKHHTLWRELEENYTSFYICRCWVLFRTISNRRSCLVWARGSVPESSSMGGQSALTSLSCTFSVLDVTLR